MKANNKRGFVIAMLMLVGCLLPMQAQAIVVMPQLTAGTYHTVALKSDGTVVAWGYNVQGQTTVPAGLTGVIAIAAGSYYTVALKSDGTVVAWGSNLHGQTTVPAGLTGVTAIAAGGNHTVALKSDGTVVAWGSNSQGQTTIPTGLTGVTAIAARGDHTVALKSDGTVVVWGSSGLGLTTIPTGLTGVTAIAAGSIHTVVLKSDGTVVAWGWNGFLQTTIPTGLNSVTSIAAGAYHTVALKSDGTVVVWGGNSFSQTMIPTGLTGVISIAAGIYHTVALKSDGSVVAWGRNNYAQSVVPVGLNLGGTPAANNTLLGTGLGDVNGNGSGDVAVLGKHKSTGRYVVRVKDPNTVPHLIREIGLNGAYKPAALLKMPDVNGNGSTDIAVLEVDPATGLNRQIQVKDGLTGTKIVNISLKRSLKPVQMVVLPDANGNGSADLAVLEVDPATGLNRQIQVKDGRTGALIRNILLKQTVKPHQMVSVGLINGAPALAISEVDAVTGKNVQIQVKNARAGALISNIRVNPNYKPHMLVALPDVNGNGSPDLALSEVDAVTGKNTQIQVKDAKTGGKISNVRVNTSVKPHMLVSVGNIGGMPALALSEVNATTGKNVQIQVKNARTGALIRNIRVNSTTKPNGLIVLADINGNGSPELALSEVNATTGKNVQVQVKDAQTGAKIRNIPMNPNYTPLGMDTGPDSNGNGVAEIGLLGVNGAGNVQVQIKDPLTGGKVSNLLYPNF